MWDIYTNATLYRQVCKETVYKCKNISRPYKHGIVPKSHEKNFIVLYEIQFYSML